MTGNTTEEPVRSRGVRIEWSTEVGQLAAIEPSSAEIATHAAALAAGYNDPANARLMGHAEPISPDEVIEHYADMREDGARAFLLFCDTQLVGDADLRGLDGGAAEFAFMIAAPNLQGRGLGTRFARMLHAFAFHELGLHRVYASVVPHNTASRRVFEKLGYALDESAEARAFADEPGDLVLSIERATFERLHAAQLPQISIVEPPASRG
jgi:RimJ/RimL family protein N-acetyltransferase